MDVGQVAVGQVADGQVAVGQVAVGQVAVGQVAVGQVAVGQWLSAGQVANGCWPHALRHFHSQWNSNPVSNHLLSLGHRFTGHPGTLVLWYLHLGCL